MTGLVRRATLITAAGLLAATAAMAGVPSATTSTQPGPIVTLVSHGSPPLPIKTITYLIRDASMNPVAGSIVILNFSACNDVRLCSSDVAVGLTTNCPGKSVTGVTSGAGIVSFDICGAENLLAGASAAPPCVSVTADGVPMTPMIAVCLDYNGAAGVDPNDLGFIGSDILSNVYHQRSNFDGIGFTNNNGNDLGIFAGIFFANAGAFGTDSSCATLCP